jgi:hypothetical protein
VQYCNERICIIFVFLLRKIIGSKFMSVPEVTAGRCAATTADEEIWPPQEAGQQEDEQIEKFFFQDFRSKLHVKSSRSWRVSAIFRCCGYRKFCRRT